MVSGQPAQLGVLSRSLKLASSTLNNRHKWVQGSLIFLLLSSKPCLSECTEKWTEGQLLECCINQGCSEMLFLRCSSGLLPEAGFRHCSPISFLPPVTAATTLLPLFPVFFYLPFQKAESGGRLRCGAHIFNPFQLMALWHSAKIVTAHH